MYVYFFLSRKFLNILYIYDVFKESTWVHYYNDILQSSFIGISIPIIDKKKCGVTLFLILINESVSTICKQSKNSKNLQVDIP
jgi:hypothetical protein